jgi:PhoD related phosphatase/WW domain
MFLNRPAGKESSVVEPLRIKKRHTATSPTPSSDSETCAVAASSPPSNTVYPMPALPYPDGPRQQSQQGQSTNGSSVPYPYPDLRRVGSPNQGGYASQGLKDSTQRNGSGSSLGGQAGDTPAALRPNNGRAPATLAERRGNIPKPFPESFGAVAPDSDGLFQRPPIRDQLHPSDSSTEAPEKHGSIPDYGHKQQYWPPPESTSIGPGSVDKPPINRISSTASTSTTRAQRGSPPPPETPIIVAPSQRPVTDIEARYAASGIAGASTLTQLQAQSAAAQQRAANYGEVATKAATNQSPPRRPWTPTEQPGSSSHPAPTVYQGPGEANQSPPPPVTSPGRQTAQPIMPQSPTRIPPNAFENDFARLQVTDEPPPAYSSTPGAVSSSRYPNEKARKRSSGSRFATAAATAAASVAVAAPVPAADGQQPRQQDHPAFANDPRQPQFQQQQQQLPQQDLDRRPSMNGVPLSQQDSIPQRHPSQTQLPPASPPPLPEGWIAHMDPNSGQYYYIHLPTQSTQWEFPKGPTPLNLHDSPLSPSASVYHNPLASPGLLFASKPLISPGLPISPMYDQQSVLSLGSSVSNPTAFTGPPPCSGVDLYKVVATNGVYFGPYLRYTNMDLENGIWLGSILLVTDAPHPPTIHIHQSDDLSPNPRQLKALNIWTHRRWTFYKYLIDLKMEHDGAAKWTYAITSHLGCTRYEFVVAGRFETNWRFVATSGNDFSLNVSANERARLGGVGFMWKDIMQKHAEVGGFHCQLGLGGQIYADRLWKEIPLLRQWLATSGKENRKNAAWTAVHEEEVSHAYFHYYTSHFDQPYLREAYAQIPHILTIDDHDMQVFCSDVCYQS